jgi:hypothetical protein
VHLQEDEFIEYIFKGLFLTDPILDLGQARPRHAHFMGPLTGKWPRPISSKRTMTVFVATSMGMPIPDLLWVLPPCQDPARRRSRTARAAYQDPHARPQAVQCHHCRQLGHYAKECPSVQATWSQRGFRGAVGWSRSGEWAGAPTSNHAWVDTITTQPTTGFKDKNRKPHANFQNPASSHLPCCSTNHCARRQVTPVPPQESQTQGILPGPPTARLCPTCRCRTLQG